MVSRTLKESSILERGSHHRVVQNVTEEVSLAGATSLWTNTFTELANSIHFWRDNRWFETREEFKLFPGGAAATEGPHQLILAPNINEGGSVDLLTSDGKRFLSNPMGLSFRDTVTGNTVLIAEVKDSIGELVAPNVIIYPDAFTDFKGTLRYTYTATGFEQDVIIYDEDFGQPADYGLDPATTHFEMWTEFFDPPVPVKKPQQLAIDLVDENLDFGATLFGEGKAFLLEDGTGAIPSAKTWIEVERRQFLVESLAYRDVRPLLDKLKPHANADDPAKRVRRMAKVVKGSNRLVASVGVKQREKKLQTASIKKGQFSREPGVVLDYTTSNLNTNNYTFKSDTTYYISANVTLSGTTTFEGGTVIKYANTNTAGLTVSGTTISQSAMFRPVILTARDDHSVGDPIGTNVLSGLYADTALNVNTSLSDLKCFRILYAKTAMKYAYSPSSTHVLSHAQIAHCNIGFTAAGATLNLRNALLYDVQTNLYAITSSPTWNVENLTVNQANYLVVSNYAGAAINLTNCLLVAVTNMPYYYNSASTSSASSSNGVFQTVGAGGHYLVSASPYRNAGTTNINASLLADIKKRTTYPPMLLTDKVSSYTVLSPQAPRDTDAPDQGYHYDPIDFAVSTFTVTNALLVLTNGVSIATLGTTGIWLQDNSQLVSEGSPLRRNQFSRFYAVQEFPTNWLGGQLASALTITTYTYTNTPPSLRLWFSDFNTPAGGGMQLYVRYADGWKVSALEVRDCQFFGGPMDLWDHNYASFGFTNNFFDRLDFRITEASKFDAYNNLFRANTGFLWQTNATNNTWTFRDNLLDTCGIENVSSNMTRGYNGFYQSDQFFDTVTNRTNEITLTNLTYQSALLGNYYLPTTATNLINKGSRNADLASLYHYTSATNQVKETNSVIDVGLHYAALSSSLAWDSDGDGIPDYLEDRNGNGSYESANGETDWGTYNSPNGLASGTDILVYTPLK